MAKMNPNEIKLHETFKSLFSIDPKVLAALEEDMSIRGYDDSLPVVLANWNGQRDLVCIDGHTRLQAAINVGIEEVPYFFHELETEQEALELSVHYQKDRRNMTDAEILTYMEVLDRRKERGGDRKSEEVKSMPQGCGNEDSRSASAKETGKTLGISSRKVEQARTVMTHADSETIEQVKQGKKSINRACEETQERRRAEKTLVKPRTAQPSEPVDVVPESPEQAVVEQNEESTPENVAVDRMEDTSVILALEHYRALQELNGASVEYHVGCAIDEYLRVIGYQYEEDDEGFDESPFE